ncbi:MAG: tail fiber protein [Verrucomicrobiota bacterium]
MKSITLPVAIPSSARTMRSIRLPMAPPPISPSRPRGWTHCDGKLLEISKNKAMFSLLGRRFGGDGRTNFRVPDLRGAEKAMRVAMGLPEEDENGGPRFLIALVGEWPYPDDRSVLSGDTIGMIRLTPLDYDRPGWLPCDGRVLDVMKYEALTSLIKNRYGGDGKSTIRLPDLRKAEEKLAQDGEGKSLLRYVICVQGTFPTKDGGGNGARGGPFDAEMRLFAPDFAPANWLACDGQKLRITGNEEFFDLIRVTYGGEGRVDFEIPDCSKLEEALKELTGMKESPAYIVRQQGEWPYRD